MSFDEKLGERVRAVLTDCRDVEERRMFGGLCFMVGGHMCCGLTSTDFMVRVGPDNFAAALALRYARPMDFTGRPLKGMVYVAKEGLRTSAALRSWVLRGLKYVESLPPKPAKPRQKHRRAIK